MQDRLIELRLADFTGRESQLQAFRQNLELPAASSHFRSIFAISGPAGAGKTWLVMKYRQIIEQKSGVTAYLDEKLEDIPEAMGKIAGQLEKQGFRLELFSTCYPLYLQKREEIHFAGPSPIGVTAWLDAYTHRAGLKPDYNEALFSFANRIIRIQDEVKLVSAAVQGLTPAFIQDLNGLAARQRTAILIDSFERTAPILDAWLRQVFSNDLELTANLLFVIAGRENLPANDWAPLAKLIKPIHVDAFNATEVADFLFHKGIGASETGALITALSGSLPAPMAYLTGTLESETITPSAVLEHYTAGLNDPGKSSLFLDAALGRTCSLAACKALLLAPAAPSAAPPTEDTGSIGGRDGGQDVGQGDRAEELSARASGGFAWLKTLPFVQYQAPHREGQAGQYSYLPVVRRAILRYLHEKETPSPLDDLLAHENSHWSSQHTALGDDIQHSLDELDLAGSECWKDPHAADLAVELVYHRLCAHPSSFLPAALGHFLAALQAAPAAALRVAQAIQAAGLDHAQASIVQWGQQLSSGLTAFNEKRYPETLAMLAGLIAFPGIPGAQVAFAQAWRGEIYLLQSQYNEAIASFAAAIALEPDYAQAISRRGAAWYQLQHYDVALADFNRALALKPQDDWSLAYRGDIYRWKKQYRRALEDFQLAVSLNDKNEWALARLGEVYRLMGAYPRAIATFNRVIARSPTDARSLALRGEAHRANGQPAAALVDFDAALQLNPQDAWTIARRGEAHFQLGHLDPALEDFDRAIQLDPQDAWTRIHRGIFLLRRKSRRPALADFAVVLQSDPQNLDALLLRGQVLEQMHRYPGALADFDLASQIQPDNPMIYFERGRIHLALRHYRSAQEDFNHAAARLPTFSALFVYRGKTLAAQRSFDLALADLDQAILVAPRSRLARLTRLQLHLRLHHFAAAFADVAILLKLTFQRL
jgi:tetratricopeptide (TPR) repeat protein